jgi:predicted deacylase
LTRFHFQDQTELYEFPYCRFVGATGGGEPIHIGVFGGIHGDEPQSAFGLLRFFQELNKDAARAEGFVIHGYPVCNPVGFAKGTRCNGRGKDLNREFWRDSREAEISFLEEELERRRFHGIISLHCDDTSHGLYGFLSGRQPSEVLSASLLEPALRAGERFLPRNCDPLIDGFGARSGILRSCYEGVLRAPASQSPPPFEITFETPQLAPAELQIEAFSAALLVILDEYRRILSHAPNL